MSKFESRSFKGRKSILWWTGNQFTVEVKGGESQLKIGIISKDQLLKKNSF